MEKSTHIKRLYSDHGWKYKSEYECKVCNKRFSAPMKDNDYKISFPLVEEHLINEHPEYCYTCPKCYKLFVNKSLLKKCKHN